MNTRTLTAAAVERIRAPTSGQIDHFDQGPHLLRRQQELGVLLQIVRQTEAADAGTLAQHVAVRCPRRMAQRPHHNRQGRKPPASAAGSSQQLRRRGRRMAHNRSYAIVKRNIERCVLPAWEGRQISTIGRRDINDLIDGVVDRGAVTMARRLNAYLHRLFRWAVGRGILETNPMAHLPKPGGEAPRDRVLSDLELAQVFKNVIKLHLAPSGPMFQMLILTGARRTEIAALRWSEIKDDTIILPRERTKSGEVHSIPLAPQALAILNQLPRI